MLVRGPCPHDNIHIRIKQSIKLLVRGPCPHDNIHQIYRYYNSIQFKILLSLNNTVCDNYTNKHLTKTT